MLSGPAPCVLCGRRRPVAGAVVCPDCGGQLARWLAAPAIAAAPAGKL